MLLASESAAMIRQGDAGSIVQIIVGRFGPEHTRRLPRANARDETGGASRPVYESSREVGDPGLCKERPRVTPVAAA